MHIYVLHIYTHIAHFVYSSVDGHLGGFYLLSVVNTAAMNMNIQKTLPEPAFGSLGYVSRSRIVGP